ncbi:MAG: hypothetical protein IT463_01095 [Planctomycetes bacterium]|nr:hypothetical protein [Planctomycetota bacterium]
MNLLFAPNKQAVSAEIALLRDHDDPDEVVACLHVLFVSDNWWALVTP